MSLQDTGSSNDSKGQTLPRALVAARLPRWAPLGHVVVVLGEPDP